MVEKLRTLRISIRYKLMILFLAATVAPLSVATLLARTNAESALLDTGRANQEARAQNTARVIDEYLTAHLQDAVVTGNLPEVRDYAVWPVDSDKRERVRTALGVIQKKDPAFETVALLSPGGTVLVSTGATERWQGFAYNHALQEAAAGRATISDAALSPTTGKPALYLCAPVRGSDGAVAGVVRIQLNLSGLLQRIAEDSDSFGQGSAGMLVDQYGIRLALSDAALNVTPAENPDGLLFTAIAPITDEARQRFAEERRFGETDGSVAVEALPGVAGAIGGAGGSAEIKGASGDAEVLSYATLAAKPWQYVVTTPRSVFVASASRTAGQLTSFGIMTGSIAALLGLFFAHAMTRPILKLSKAADAVSMGDTETVVEVPSNDEIGDLAASFSRMMASVRFYMASFRESEDEGDSSAAA